MDQFTTKHREEAILRRFAAVKFLNNLDDAMEHDPTGDFAPMWARNSLVAAMEQLSLMLVELELIVQKESKYNL